MMISVEDVNNYKIIRVKAEYAGTHGYRVMIRMESRMINQPTITLHSFNTRGFSVRQALVLVRDISHGFLSIEAEAAIIDKVRPAAFAIIELMSFADKRGEETSLSMVKRLAAQALPS